MALQRRTSKESVLTAFALFALRFRDWAVAETKAMKYWKDDPTPNVIVEGKMADDVARMIDTYRKSGARLPRLMIAIQRLKDIPDPSQLYRIPFELNTRIPTDPKARNVKIRAIARAFRVQFAFLVNDPDTARSFTDQFSNFIEDQSNRRFLVSYEFAKDVKDDWHLTILDNSIFPDSASIGEDNIEIGLLDFTVQGLLPQVTAGLPEYGDTDQEEDPDSVKPGWKVVVEADMNKGRQEQTFKRLKADPVTGEHSSEDLPRGTTE